MSDDEIIGLKSTSIKFKNNIRLFVACTYIISILLIFYLFKNFLGTNLFTLFTVFFIMSLVYQLFKFKKDKSKNYLKLFKYNNFSGMFLFFGIYFINL